jgi:hypothetical protein
MCVVGATIRAKLPGRYSIVIGYGGKRGEHIAEQMRMAMKQRGLRVFVAPSDMIATPDWRAVVRQKIETFDAYVLLCNKEACCSEIVMEEMDWAGLEKIIPFRLNRQKVHPMAAKAHNFHYDTRHPNYDLYKEQIRNSIEDFRDKVRKANRSLQRITQPTSPQLMPAPIPPESPSGESTK